MNILTKTLFRSNAVTMAFLCAAAALVSAAAYPEIFITFKTSFVLWYDYCVDYPLTFVLTKFLYQGELPLWNFFGQISFVHTYGVVGLFKLPNVVTAIAYHALEPFSTDSSRLFHHVFAWANLMTLLCVRVAGIFLLLKTVTKDRWILTVGTIVFAVFFSQFAFLRGQFYMSCFPLGMYFIVRFFQEMHWRYLACIILFFMTGLGSGVLMGGYLYLPLHFFMLAGILWRVFFYAGPSRFLHMRPNSRGQWQAIAGALLAAVLIIAPYVYIVKFGFTELAFNQAHSRISHMFSPHWYFNTTEMDTRLVFQDILNMQTVMTTYSLYYAGWTFLVLALIGAIFSGNKLKWFFLLGFALLWFLGMPREHLNSGLVAHWINVLTNPLKTLPRSYQNACQPMIPFLLMPLVAMGIEAVVSLCRGKKYSGVSFAVLGAGVLLLAAANISSLPAGPRAYLIVCTVLILLGLGWAHLRDSKRARHFLAGTLCCLAVMDIIFVIYQTKAELIARCVGKPVVLDASPSSGLVGYDFENPSIFPVPNSYTLHFSYKDEVYLWFPQGPSSDMRHVVNQALGFTYLNGYNPRHAAFENWVKDPQMLAYLSQNSKFIFLAEAAINASPDALDRITAAGLARQVAAVEDEGRAMNLPDQWPGGIVSGEGEKLKYSQISGTLEEGGPGSYRARGDMVIFSFKLPADFPGHLASSWFPAEQPYLRFLVEQEGQEWQEFAHAQGELIRPLTFDVQNIKKGVLHAAFSKNDFPLGRKFVVLYPSIENEGVKAVWRKQFDNLGITYTAKKDGWLVCHYPYDTKFRISVDGKQVRYFRTNKSFIGFPLARGDHEILIQYWPGSILRVGLLISALITVLGFLALIFLALRWEPAH